MTESFTLADVSSINPRPDKPSASDDVVSFLGMADVEANGTTAEGTDRPFADVSKGYTQFKRGDILVAKITPCFENGKIAQALTRNLRAAGSTEFHVVRPKPGILDPRYLHYFLRQPTIRIEGERRMTGSAGQRRVPQSYLAGLRILLPALEEQERIAKILDQADSLLATRMRAIPLLDELTQSIFLDMFGDPLSNPRSWPLRAMGELFRAKPCYGTMIPASKDKGEWLCLRVANIQDWELDLRDEKFVDLDPLDVDRHSVVDRDMILARAIATEEHLGKSVIAYPGNKRWAFDSHLMRIRFNREMVVPEFVREALRTPGGRKLFLSVTRRSAVQYNINTKEIGSLRIPVPALDLQEEYLERVQHIKDLRNVTDSGLGSLNELFASLQFRAFRGEL